MNSQYFSRFTAWMFPILILSLLSLVGCGKTDSQDSERLPALKEVYENQFLVGAAINKYQLQDNNSKALSLVQHQYNSITPENLLKWENVHPQPNEYQFEDADRFIAFSKKHGMQSVGHTLVWHRQTPDWVFQNSKGQQIGEDELLDRMEQHIERVAGRYAGQIDGWDVVNEVFNEDGSYRESPWYNITGKTYIEQAYRFAHAADSVARLHYNDFNLWKPAKRDSTVALVKELHSKGIPVDAVGMQAHLGLEHPSVQQVEASILAFSELGVDVMISELDINTTRYMVENDLELRDELPDSLKQKLSSRYVELFNLFEKHSDKISRVTFWGVNDGQSWLNYWDDYEVKNHPLLFDRNNNPKPAFHAVIKSAAE